MNVQRKMIGIKNIANYIPRRYESNFYKKEKFNVDDSFIVNKIGVHRVSRKAINEETSDMCINAFRALSAKAKVPLDEIGCIIVCTQNPDGDGIPHTSAIVHEKLGLRLDCASFDISLGCSGYVYSLAIAISFMEQSAIQKGLLFTADPYSKIIDPSDRNTAMLFGDASTVTLLTHRHADEILWHPLKFIYGSYKESSAIRKYKGQIHMKGKAVVNFATKMVPDHISKLLDSLCLNIDEIDLFIFHQGSKYLIEKLQEKLKLPPEKVPSNLSSQGNTVSSSIPLLLEYYLAKSEMDTIVLSGFGVGLSAASCILRKMDH